VSVSSVLRRFVIAAQQAGGPVAVWRRPNGDRFEAAASLAPMTPQPLFDGDGPRPGFVLSQFDEPAAGTAALLRADAVITGDAVRFVDSRGSLGDAAVTPAQKQLLAAAEAADVATRVRAGRGAVAPAQTDRAGYAVLVGKAVATIGEGRFSKVVTSRAERQALPAGADLLALAERLATRYPAAFVALVLRPGQDAWLVATPETLLSQRGGEVRTMALAGTQAVADDVDLRSVSWTDKFIEEQALVSHYIRRAFADAGIADYRESGPRTVRAANLAHLRTEFVSAAAPEISAKLLANLHPTAAVCGQPKAPAVAFLREHEGYDRSCYTGFLGPVDIDGGSDLYVNLRTSQIIGDDIYLYVGGGIVGDSDPEAEWQETVEKTKTIGVVLTAD